MRSLLLIALVPLSALAFCGENSGLGVGVGMTSRGPAPVIIDTLPADGSTTFSSTPLIRFVFSTDMDVTRTDIAKVGLPAGLTATRLAWNDARTLDIIYGGFLPNFGAKRVDLFDGYFMTPGKISIALGAGLAFNFADTNRPPYIIEQPSLTFINSVANFKVVAFDPDGDPLTYVWDLGDGATGTGPAVEHRYATEGPYLVVATVSDGRGGVATATVLVSAMAKAPWIVTKATIGLNFAKADKDKIMVAGTVELPPGWDPNGKGVIVAIGTGISATFTMDGKGLAKAGKNTLKLTRKLKKKQFLGGAVKISFKLAGSFQAALDADGLNNTTTPKTGTTVSLKITLVLDKQPYESVVDFIYKAKAGKTGKATKKTAMH